jgi:hypothetical protein
LRPAAPGVRVRVRLRAAALNCSIARAITPRGRDRAGRAVCAGMPSIRGGSGERRRRLESRRQRPLAAGCRWAAVSAGWSGLPAARPHARTGSPGRLGGWAAGAAGAAGRLGGWAAGRLGGWVAGRLGGWAAAGRQRGRPARGAAHVGGTGVRARSRPAPPPAGGCGRRVLGHRSRQRRRWQACLPPNGRARRPLLAPGPARRSRGGAPGAAPQQSGPTRRLCRGRRPTTTAHLVDAHRQGRCRLLAPPARAH